MGEGFVEIAGWLFEDAEGDFDSGGAESGDALTAHLRVGVLCGDDAAGDAGFDESVGAGRGAAVMAAGFEGDIGGGTLCGDASCGGLFECDDFSVVAVGIEMCSFADDLWCAGRRVFCENAADLWIGRSEAYGLGGESEGSLHECLVLWVLRHRFKNNGF